MSEKMTIVKFLRDQTLDWSCSDRFWRARAESRNFHRGTETSTSCLDTCISGIHGADARGSFGSLPAKERQCVRRNLTRVPQPHSCTSQHRHRKLHQVVLVLRLKHIKTRTKCESCRKASVRFTCGGDEGVVISPIIVKRASFAHHEQKYMIRSAREMHWTDHLIGVTFNLRSAHFFAQGFR